MSFPLKVAHSFAEEGLPYSQRFFEEAFQVDYLRHLEFANWKVERWLRKYCQQAVKKRKIPQYALWLGKLHQREISRGEVLDVTIRWLDENIGYGAFTNVALQPWEFVGEYTGVVRRKSLLFPRINDYCFLYPKLWISLNSFTIDSEKQGNFTRFINHSDHPNLESISVVHDGVFHIIFRALRSIRPGEELTYDYGDLYWLRRKKLPH